MLWANRRAAPISRYPKAVLELVDTLLNADAERSNDCLNLLSRTLDGARLNNENEEPGAHDFFQALASGLADQTKAGVLDAETCFGVCRAYLRAGLTPPNQLRTVPDTFEAPALDQIPELPDVAGLADGLILGRSTPFESYTGLREVAFATRQRQVN